MALNMMGLGFVFEAVDHASHVISNIEHKFSELEEHTGIKVEGMQSSFKQLGVGLAALYTGMKGFEGAFELAEYASEAERGLLSLKATTGATAEEMEQLEKAALKATKGTDFGSGKGIETLKTLMEQSYDTKDAIELLRPVLDFSALTEGKVSPEAAAAGISKIMKAYEIDVGDAAIVVDQMAQAVTKWGLSASSLPMALARAEKGARQINASMTEVMMVTGLVKDGFRNQIVAANEVGQAMAKLADPKTVAAFGKFKDKMNMKDANGEFRSFMDIATDLDPILKQMGPEKEKDWLNKTFGPSSVMEKTINKIRLGIKDSNGELVRGAAAAHALQAGFVDSKDKAKNMIDILRSGFGTAVKQMEKMKGDLMEELGAGFLKVLTPAIQKAARVLEWFVELIRETPMPLKMAVAWLAVVGSAALGVVGAIMALGVVAPIMNTAWKAGIATLRSFAAAAWTAIVPMLPWVLLAAAIGGAIWLIYNASDETKEMIWKFALILGGAAAIALGFSAIMGYPLAAVLGLSGAVSWLTGQLTLMYITMLLNPFGVVLGVVIALVFWLYQASGGWNDFVAQWKFGVQAMGEFFEKWLFKPARDLWEWLSKIAGWFGKETGSKLNNGQEELATGINDVVRVDRAGNVIGKGLHLPGTEGAEGQPTEGGLPGMPEVPGAVMPKMPAGMEKLAAAAQQQQAGAEGGSSPLPGFDAMMAAAKEQSKAAAIDYEKMADALSKRPMNMSMEIDGEIIGRAVIRAQRVSMARAGVAVPSE